MNILIIGIGNIGKRHLQSLSKLPFKVNFYLYDIKKYKISLFNNRHKIHVLENFPKKINFEAAIIATTSIDRYKLLKKLVSENNIRKIILEKIAFLTKRQYLNSLKINNLLINYPRPLMKSYVNIKKYLKYKEIIGLSVYGNNWNMLSNTPHFMNLFLFITNSNLSKIDSIKIHNRKYLSKRSNFHEIKGRILFTNEKFQFLELSDSIKNKRSFIKIITRTGILKIYESLSYIILIDYDNNTKVKKSFKLEYQSDLTHKVLFSSEYKKQIKFLFLEKCINQELLYIDFINNLKKSNDLFSNLTYS